jgi:hypothetical protein
MMETLRSFEMSVLTTATPCNTPEDDVLHSHLRETPNLTYIAPFCHRIAAGKSPSTSASDKTNTQTNKQTPWALFRERTIPTDRPPLVYQI